MTRRRSALILALAAILAALAAPFLLRKTLRFYTDGRDLREDAARSRETLREILWEEPRRLPDGIDRPGTDEYEPRVSPDGTLLVFTRGRPGGSADLWVSRRRLGGWGEPVPLEPVNSPRDDMGASFGEIDRSRGILALFFYSNRPGGEGGYDLWASLFTEGGDWSEPRSLGPLINSPWNEFSPSLAPDGSTLYFASNRRTGGSEPPARWTATLREAAGVAQYDIFSARRAGDSLLDFVEPRAVAALNFSGSSQGAIAISPLGDYIYFSSNRPGGLGGFDLYRSRILASGLGSPQNLGPQVNTAGGELDPALASSGFELYFARRPDGEAAEDIYVTSSREVFLLAEKGETYWSFAAVRSSIFDFLRRMDPTILALFLSCLLCLFFVLFFGRRLSRLQIITRCFLIALVIHLILALWMNKSKVQRVLLTALRREEPPEAFEVRLGGSAEEDVAFSIRSELAETGRDAASPFDVLAANLAPSVEAEPAPSRLLPEAARPASEDLSRAPVPAPEPERATAREDSLVRSLREAEPVFPEDKIEKDPDWILALRQAAPPPPPPLEEPALDVAGAPRRNASDARADSRPSESLPLPVQPPESTLALGSLPLPEPPSEAALPPAVEPEARLEPGAPLEGPPPELLFRSSEISPPQAAPPRPAMTAGAEAAALRLDLPGPALRLPDVSVPAVVSRLDAAISAEAAAVLPPRIDALPGIETPREAGAPLAGGPESIEPSLPASVDEKAIDDSAPRLVSRASAGASAGEAVRREEATGEADRSAEHVARDAVAPQKSDAVFFPTAPAASPREGSGGHLAAAARAAEPEPSEPAPIRVPSAELASIEPAALKAGPDADAGAGMAPAVSLPEGREEPALSVSLGLERPAAGEPERPRPAEDEVQLAWDLRPTVLPAARLAEEMRDPWKASLEPAAQGDRARRAAGGEMGSSSRLPPETPSSSGVPEPSLSRPSLSADPSPLPEPGGGEPPGPRGLSGSDAKALASPPEEVSRPEAGKRVVLELEPQLLPRVREDDRRPLAALAPSRSPASGGGIRPRGVQRPDRASIEPAALKAGLDADVEAGAAPAVSLPEGREEPALSVSPGRERPAAIEPPRRKPAKDDVRLARDLRPARPRAARPAEETREPWKASPEPAARGTEARRAPAGEASRGARLPPATRSSSDLPATRRADSALPAEPALPLVGGIGETSEPRALSGKSPRAPAPEPKAALRSAAEKTVVLEMEPRPLPRVREAERKPLAALAPARAPASAGQGLEPRAADRPNLAAGPPGDVAGRAAAKPVAEPGSLQPVPATSSFVPRIYELRGKTRREEALRLGGGSRETEVAVARGLRWLALHQSPDGRWDLRDYARHLKAPSQRDLYHPDWSGRGRHDSRGGSSRGSNGETAATGLALLAFLAHGDTHVEEGPYKESVKKGLGFLLSRIKPSGDLRGGGNLYMHGIASFALCEAYALTRDPELAEPCRRAIGYTLKAQNPQLGGWRYDPYPEGTDVDTSVFGWMVMALKSARLAEIDVDEGAVRRMARYLESARMTRTGGKYAYQPGLSRTSLAMTAQGLFCHQLLLEFLPPASEAESQRARRAAQESVGHLLENKPEARDQDGANFYYWYYATLALFQEGGPAWTQWNQRLREIVLKLQVPESEGTAAGSWDPLSRRAEVGGRVYSTALCTLCLEVYYRYAPKDR